MEIEFVGEAGFLADEGITQVVNRAVELTVCKVRGFWSDAMYVLL